MVVVKAAEDHCQSHDNAHRIDGVADDDDVLQDHIPAADDNLRDIGVDVTLGSGHNGGHRGVFSKAQRMARRL